MFDVGGSEDYTYVKWEDYTYNLRPTVIESCFFDLAYPRTRAV